MYINALKPKEQKKREWSLDLPNILVSFSNQPCRFLCYATTVLVGLNKIDLVSFTACPNVCDLIWPNKTGLASLGPCLASFLIRVRTDYFPNYF